MPSVETTTTNYHWIKPAIGGSTTVWGNRLNDDLDGIDNQVAANATAVTNLSAVVQPPNVIQLLSPVAPASNAIYGGVGATQRWALYLGDGETETGGNAGSNFLIQGYSDAGAQINSPLEIIRSSGRVIANYAMNVGGALTVGGTAGFNAGVSVTGGLTATGAASFGGSLNVSGAGTVGGLASFPSGITFPSFYGHTLQFGWDGANVRIKVDGTDIGGIAIAGSGVSFLPISGGTITGNLGINGTLGVGGAASFSSTVSSSGVIGTSQYFNVSGSPTALFARELQLDTNVTIAGGSGGGMSLSVPASTGITFNAGGVEMSEMDYGGNFFVAGQAFKPVAGGWLSSSDARVKTIEHPYTLGLDEIMKLKPIVYRYKANDAEPGKTSRVERFKDRSYAGLIAQDVESIFPNMVDKRKGWIDGREVDDLRTLDTYELMFALVNAVKTLTARVQELEAR